MGAADVVPGVSGGTIALITGIYDRLIFSISELNILFVFDFLRKNKDNMINNFNRKYGSPKNTVILMMF